MSSAIPKLWLQVVQDQLGRWYGSVKMALAHPKREPEFIEVNGKDQCVYCKGWHARYCGRVHRIRFNERGDPAEIEYWPDTEWDQTRVIFLDTEKMEGETVAVSIKEASD